MKVLQIVAPAASEYERKCQRADLAALAGSHEVTVTGLDSLAGHQADVAHVYGSPLPAGPFVGFRLPYVASAQPERARWALRRPAEPAVVVSPLWAGADGRERKLPEPVEEAWFQWRDEAGGWRRPERAEKVVASFRRPGLESLVERTMGRIARVREDVSWVLFERAPSPADLADVDLWVDPAAGEEDFDGFVAEALVAGVPVLAARTAMNELRLERGRTGGLVRAGDPNEWSHAILGALFKSEVTDARIVAAGQTSARFRSRQRARVLARIYQSLIP